jgi:hypothetical protein
LNITFLFCSYFVAPYGAPKKIRLTLYEQMSVPAFLPQPQGTKFLRRFFQKAAASFRRTRIPGADVLSHNFFTKAPLGQPYTNGGSF